MKIRFYDIIALLCGLFCASTVCATEVLPSADSVSIRLGEVTVTALKGDADLRGTIVLDEAAATQNRLATVRDASAMTPGIFMPDYGSRMTSTIYVRGIGARIDQPSLGLSIDNVPVLCKENYDFDLTDLARIDILRGPQSSLYGRNTLAGQINVHTLSPFEWQGTRVLLEGGSASSFKVGASYYGKPSERFAWSAAAYFTTTAGQFTNQYNGKRCDWERQGNVRLKHEWKPSGSLSLSNTLSVGLSRQGGYPYEYVETGMISYNDTCFYRRNSLLDAFTLRKQFGRCSLTSITSYQWLDDNMTLDQDFTPKPYFTLTQKRKEHAFTQEFIVKSLSTGPVRWLAGAFGFVRSYRMYAPVTFRDTGIKELIEDHVNSVNPSYPIAWLTRQFVLESNFRSSNAGGALYTQWAWTHRRLTLTAALRADFENAFLDYNSDTETGYNIVHQATGELYRTDLIAIHDDGSLKKHFFQLLPRLRADFTVLDDERVNLSLRAVVSKGYKAGGFNTQMFSDVLQQRLMGIMGIGRKYDLDEVVGYKPEKAWNYEVGGAVHTADGKLRADMSLYYIDCTDRQLTTFPDGTTTGRVMTNAGKSRSMGLETSLSYAPTAKWAFNASYALCDAKFIEYNDGRGDYADKRVPYAPKHTLFAQALCDLDCGTVAGKSLRLTLDAHVKGAGDIFWNEANTMRQPFYAIAGASVTAQIKHFSLQIWGENLTNTRYHTFYFMSIGHEFVQRGKKPQFGATLRITFDK